MELVNLVELAHPHCEKNAYWKNSFNSDFSQIQNPFSSDKALFYPKTPASRSRAEQFPVFPAATGVGIFLYALDLKTGWVGKEGERENVHAHKRIPESIKLQQRP